MLCKGARKKASSEIFALNFLEFHVHLAQKDRLPVLQVQLFIKKHKHSLKLSAAGFFMGH